MHGGWRGWFCLVALGALGVAGCGRSNPEGVRAEQQQSAPPGVPRAGFVAAGDDVGWLVAPAPDPATGQQSVARFGADGKLTPVAPLPAMAVSGAQGVGGELVVVGQRCRDGSLVEAGCRSVSEVRTLSADGKVWRTVQLADGSGLEDHVIAPLAGGTGSEVVVRGAFGRDGKTQGMTIVHVDVRAGKVTSWSPPVPGTGINCVVDGTVYDIGLTGGPLTPHPVGKEARADDLVANTYTVHRLDGDRWVEAEAVHAAKRPRNDVPTCTAEGYAFAPATYPKGTEVLGWTPGGGWTSTAADAAVKLGFRSATPGATPTQVVDGTVVAQVVPGRWQRLSGRQPALDAVPATAQVDTSATTTAVCWPATSGETMCRTVERTVR